MKKNIIALLLLLIPSHSQAFSEVQNYFLDSGVRTLGRGGIASIIALPEALSLDDPYSLKIAAKSRHARLDTTYEYQRTLRLYNGNWKGTHAESDALETVIAAPFSVLGGDLKFVVAAGYENQGHDIHAISEKNKIEINSRPTFDAGRAGLLVSYREMISGAFTLDANEYTTGLEVPFEVKVTPCKIISFGYKQGFHHLKSDIDLTISGKSGKIPLSYTQNQRELYLESKIWDEKIYLRMGIDPVNSFNLNGEAKVKLPYRLYVVGGIKQWKIEGMHQLFTIADGMPGGHIDAFLKNTRYRIGFGWDITDKWNVETNYISSHLKINGGGIANARAVVDFWPSLIVGNYNYLYSGELKVDQVQLGAEYKGDRFLFQSGFQYLHLEPSFNLNYWRSVLFGFGRTGEGNERLSTDRIDMIGLFFGFGYRLGPASFNYALGQFIPVATHENKAASSGAGGGSTGSGNGGGKDIFEQIGDKISHHPGGLIQRLQLTVKF